MSGYSHPAPVYGGYLVTSMSSSSQSQEPYGGVITSSSSYPSSFGGPPTVFSSSSMSYTSSSVPYRTILDDSATQEITQTTTTTGYVKSPFTTLKPSAFPPGTDPSVVASFQSADQDNSGFIDDKEMQKMLSAYNQSFSMRTVRLLIFLFTNNNSRRIGPKEFIALFYSLQDWRVIFEKFDKDRSGRIDASELREALLSLGFAVSPSVIDLLVSKFGRYKGTKVQAIEYDNFIECCLLVKGLTEKFREKDDSYSGLATFSYESFMLTVLPFLIA